MDEVNKLREAYFDKIYKAQKNISKHIESKLTKKDVDEIAEKIDSAVAKKLGLK